MATGDAVQIAAAAVVIVNYFKAQRLVEGLDSLSQQSAAPSISIGVVNNSHTDQEQQALVKSRDRAGFTLVEPRENLGYTKGCNLGVAALDPSRYVVLCNPDIIWDDRNALQTLIAVADANPSIGVLAPLQFTDDGAMVETARSFPNLLGQVARRLGLRPSGELHLTENLEIGGAELIDIDWVQSSCVLIRRSLWDQFAGLDERYFLFMSDVELGRATWQAGFRVSMTSAARVRADGLRASAGGVMALLTSRVQRSHLMDSLRFYFRNGPRRLRRGKLAADVRSVIVAEAPFRREIS